ncbi:urea transporter [Prosthecobacter vanneervenii]|uniref:Urea transporter n=1 Tax=Prosthecobacter vanneervenii TaxID=48466 RepID=A0A7W8DLI8_9BACT|nr:urea transporter [Prosthecobacter vanneervenii]MBB5034187.1 urea transporter [Prosthecobacter vanneervenii]
MNSEAPSTLPVMAILEGPTTRVSSLKQRTAALGRVLRPYLKTCAAPLQEAARAASSIFLCGSWKTGALLCAALLFMPRYFVFAMSACVLGGFIAKLMQLPTAMRKDGTLLYNVFLSALAVAWITRGSTLGLAAVWGMLGVVTVYTLLLSAALWHWFPLRAGLPPLSVAFVVSFGTLLTFFPHWAASTTLLDMGLPEEPALPFVATAFLRSMGTILFLPNVWAGLAVTLAVLMWSRVAMINAIVGYAGGILIVKLLEGCGLHWLGWFAGHNYLLAGMALGAVYFVPSWSSLALAFVAGGVAALHVAAVQHFLRGSGWEYLPLPYLLTIWSLLCCLRLREKPGSLLPTAGVFDNPEAAAAALALANARFPHRHETHVLLPTAREVTVTQGFDDKLSHRGEWKHALDFEVHDASGNACPPGCDDDLSRYYTQGLEVRAPGAGEILRVVDGVADNAPGGCNFASNWGNHLILRLDYGGIVKLAHFMKNGILVKTGQRVGAGELLGYCGNSGRSPVPHIHLHNQVTTETGAPTAPFCLTNFFIRSADGVRWNFAGVPKVGARIAPATVSTTVLGTLAHLAPGAATYRVSSGGEVSHETLATTLDESGRYLLRSGKESLTAVLGLHALQITQSSPGGHSSLLSLISLAMPTVPFAYQSGMNWEDCVSLQSKQHGRALAGVLAPYLGHAGVRVNTRHALHPTPQRLQFVTTLGEGGEDLPREIEFTLEPIRGLTHLTARFQDREVVYTQTDFTPTLPNGDLE